jgi:acyl-CoA dehydrogenase
MELWNSFYGVLAQNYVGLSILGTALVALAIGYNGAPFWLWSIFTVVMLGAFGAPFWLIGVAVAICAVFLITPIRRALVSSFVIKILKGVMPNISETERTALEAGAVWAENQTLIA